MRAYYALVDDILKWDEFEEAVCSLNSDSDDEESEKFAAAEVVRRYGRLHPKISKLTPKPTLNSFFCKVIEKEALKEFIRPDKSPGLVIRILVGDETGEAVLVFWDERAYAAEEINPRDVLEVAGRFKSLSNITVVDLRRSDAEICLREEGIKTLCPCLVDALILEKSKPLEYVGKDGIPAFKTILFVYDGEGFARITVWNKDTAGKIPSAGTVRISGITPRPSSFKEYSAGNSSSFDILNERINLPVKMISEINSGDLCSLKGVLESVLPVFGYQRDDGTILWLKKGVISDDTGSIPFVFWGRHAKTPMFEGDRIDLYNCHVKTSAFSHVPGGLEIHAGYKSCIVSSADTDENENEYFSAEGVVTELPEGFFLVNEDYIYLLKGADFKPGEEIEVSGIRNGHIISVQSRSPVLYDYQSLTERLHLLKDRFSAEKGDLDSKK